MILNKVFTVSDDLFCNRIKKTRIIPHHGLEKKYQASGGSISITEIEYKDFSIFHGNSLNHNSKTVNFENQNEAVCLLFQFCGDISITGKRKKDDDAFEVKCKEQTLSYQPKGALQISTVGCPEMHFFELSISPEYFAKYMPEAPLFLYFQEQMAQQVATQIYPENGKITPEMEAIIQEILNTKKTGNFKKLFIESKVLALLSLVLEYYSEDAVVELQTIHSSHTQKIIKAKKLIEENLYCPCSLIDLAHLVGTNECTLKKGFKELTGSTVFGYWNDLKMESAYKMITDSDMPIYEIAQQLGYKHPHHFTAAFKKKYNVTPIELRASIVAKAFI